jgi:hypothetical protein
MNASMGNTLTHSTQIREYFMESELGDLTLSLEGRRPDRLIVYISLYFFIMLNVAYKQERHPLLGKGNLNTLFPRQQISY